MGRPKVTIYGRGGDVRSWAFSDRNSQIGDQMAPLELTSHLTRSYAEDVHLLDETITISGSYTLY